MLGKRLMAGGLIGLVATVPMTAVMALIYRRLPEAERYPLPQSEIADVVLRRVGLRDALSDRQEHAAIAAAHFGYGAASGALYTLLPRSISGAPALRGVGFGLLLWAGSYLGWLPALGILRPATQHPRRRTAMMVAAHIVWGAVAGLLAGRKKEGDTT